MQRTCIISLYIKNQSMSNAVHQQVRPVSTPQSLGSCHRG